MTNAEQDLSWIDEFWQKAGEHIFARDDDGVLILPPNRVYKANSTAARLVSYLKKGGAMAALALPSDEAKKDTASFFGDLAALYRGEAPCNGTVSERSYDFSFTSLPVLGEIALTYRCNNACLFCYAGCGYKNKTVKAEYGFFGRLSQKAGMNAAAEQRQEAGTKDFKRIIDIFADEAKIPFFSFTGGEPLLRNDLEELCSYAVKRGLVTNLVSNGTLITKVRAAALKKAGLGSAQISIEAPNQALHDRLCGRKGAFEACVSGIQALQEAGIPTQTNTTINRLNLSCIGEMPAFLKTLSVRRFAMNLFIPTISGAQADRLFVPYEEIAPYIDNLTLEARKEGLVFYWYSPTPFCIYNPIAKGHGNKSCAAADGLISVAPDGSVLPCSSWDAPIGNLLKEQFSSVWFSEKARYYKQKEFAPDVCKTCPHFTACQGACPLYWRYCNCQPAQRSCS